MIYNKILFDFDGVLCKDFFYSTLAETYPAVYNFINESIFGKGRDIPDKWMRAQISSDDVNRYISEQTGIDYQILSNFFIESIKVMNIDTRLLVLAKTLVANGRKVALVTNNVDVFNTVTIKHHHLDEVFPVIVNSCDYGLMKHDENGRLFEIAMEKLGESDFSAALLIDDSTKAREAFKKRGGATFPFKTYSEFEPWMNKYLLPKSD